MTKDNNNEDKYSIWNHLPDDEIPSEQFAGALNGDRAYSRMLIEHFVSGYRKSGKVSDESLEYVVSIMESVLEADQYPYPNRRPEELMKALNLGGKLDRNRRRDGLIRVMILFCQIGDNPLPAKQRNDRIIEMLQRDNLIDSEMMRFDITKRISEIAREIKDEKRIG